jgi:rhodanese-related sulfurtransferase
MLIAVVITVVGATGCIHKSDIYRDEAHRLVAQQGALLLDVRAPDEYAEDHPPAAVNIPLTELESREKELGGRDRTIIVYCHTGVRASIAAKKLREAGFTHVRNLGPISHWYVEPSDSSSTF